MLLDEKGIRAVRDQGLENTRLTIQLEVANAKIAELEAERDAALATIERVREAMEVKAGGIPEVEVLKAWIRVKDIVDAAIKGGD